MKADITPEVIRRNVSTFEAQKINEAVHKVKHQIPITFRERDFLDKVKDLIAYVVNEENTDVIIDLIAEYVPWGLGWIVKKVLDRMLPEKLLSIIYVGIDRLAD